MIKKLIYLAIAAICFTACNKDEDDTTPANNTTPTTQTAFPYIKANAVWNFQSWGSSDPGIKVADVYKITAVDEAGWCSVEWTIGSGAYAYTVPQTWYADNTLFSNLTQKPGTKFPLIKATPTLNDTYSETFPTGTGNVINTRKVVSLSESVTVPAGTFANCVKILETTNQDTIYYKLYWIDSAKGIVKTEGTTTEDYPEILYEELVSYQ